MLPTFDVDNLLSAVCKDNLSRNAAVQSAVSVLNRLQKQGIQVTGNRTVNVVSVVTAYIQLNVLVGVQNLILLISVGQLVPGTINLDFVLEAETLPEIFSALVKAVLPVCRLVPTNT